MTDRLNYSLSLWMLSRISPVFFWAAHCGKTLSLKNSSQYHLNLSSCGYQKALRSGQLKFPYTGRAGQGHQMQICDLSHFILNLSTSQMQFIPTYYV